MFKSIPLGSTIPLVYNIKPLGLIVLLIYNMNNRSMSSMIKCHILTNIVSTWKSPMANHGHSWSNIALWQQLSQCLNQFHWVHQFLWFIISIIDQFHPWSNITFWKILSLYENHPCANHGHSWSNVTLWQQLSQCLNQFPWVHQFL